MERCVCDAPQTGSGGKGSYFTAPEQRYCAHTVHGPHARWPVLVRAMATPPGSQADSERTGSDQGRVETLLCPHAYAGTCVCGLPFRPADVAVYLADAQGQADRGKVHKVFGLSEHLSWPLFSLSPIYFDLHPIL